jgi:hypothetical protein
LAPCRPSTQSPAALPRAQRDDTLVPHIERVWQANMQVYGADKVWKQMNREGIALPAARSSG